MNEQRTASRINAVTNARITQMLLEGVYTAHDIAEDTGMWINTVRRYIHAFRALRDPDQPAFRMVRRVGWDMDDLGRATRAIYKLEWGRDRARAPVTGARRNQIYRDKQAHKSLIQATAGAVE